MDRYLFDIAGRILAVEAEDLKSLQPSLSGFRTFLTDSGEPALTFVMDRDTAMPRGEVKHRFEVEGCDAELSRTERGWSFTLKNGHTTEGLWTLDTENRKAYCAVEGEKGLSNLKFMVWLAFGIMVLQDGFVSVHSSVVVKDGAAVMFLGESGTGKSTHTSLWLKYVEGAELLNDDGPFVDVSGREIVCCGSPWSGKGCCYVNAGYPIKGIVRLAQAPHNRMRRLDKLNAIGAVYPSCPPSFAFDERLSDMVFDIISNVVAGVPVYMLECLPDEAAARLSCETIFGEQMAAERK